MRTMPLMLVAFLAAGCPSDDETETDTDTDGSSETARFLSIEQSLAAQDVQWIDVRSAEEYAAGHVPGALNVPWGDLRAEVDGISGQVAPPAQVEQVLRDAGVDERPVIAYGARSGRDAARLAWTLEYYGHPARAQLMDGSWLQWMEQGLDEGTDAGGSGGSWTAGAVVPGLRVDSEWLAGRLDDGSVHIVDVRTAEEYDEAHIPGAVHVEWTENVHEDGRDIGTLKDREDLEALYRDLPKDDTIVVTCRSGARAAMTWAVLPTLGFTDVRLHDGSWNEWSAGGYPVE